MEFQVINPYPFLYHFRDPQGVCFSIIKGSKQSIVVDCGYGIGEVRKEVEKYINTPYILVATHGHMDHTSGAFQFNELYLDPRDFELYYEHNNVSRRTMNIKTAIDRKLIDDNYDTLSYINKSPAKLIPVNPGDIFDLGNLHVEVINMAGHTKGSIGLLIKEARLLLSGDGAIHMIWMFLKESTDRKSYIEMLEQVNKLAFDNFITGHLMEVYPKRFFEYYIEVAKTACPANSLKVNFNGFERPNTYQYSKNYEGINIGICYQEPKEN